MTKVQSTTRICLCRYLTNNIRAIMILLAVIGYALAPRAPADNGRTGRRRNYFEPFDRNYPVRTGNNHQFNPSLLTERSLLSSTEKSTVYKVKYGTNFFAEKQIENSVARNPEVFAEILKEIRIMRAMNNQHIIKFAQAYRTSAALCVIMEWADSGTLEEKGALSDTVVRKYSYELIGAVAYLHGRSIAHLDIKPANVLIHQNQIKLADFGVSRSFTPGSVIEVNEDDNYGDTDYWPPELMETSLPAIDIYSLGKTIAVMVTGQRSEPVPTGSPAHYLIQHMMADDYRQRPPAQYLLNDPYFRGP